ncbi:DUF3365 domain-containing protein [Echinicola jeungdonensis]|uniref:DUF3365 domain-containing protein n=1 Tax=Echinicola jeungdonensis TaxID=709343 RepID=A0ABV5J873_9BACT|nr:DUF3365 domain-containing protein [Echinicola jeungdonensis]MDN3669145.1 DUF3365 domain-containing protein [Echinicola jeungdonensis]
MKTTTIHKTKWYLALVLLLGFACQPLPEEESESTSSGKMYSIEEAFEIVAAENDVARTLYTKAIVGEGKKNGLKFHEDWEKDEVEAGPLPALFLRGIASDIKKKGEIPLGLFLGSDFPVRKSNKFVGKQAELFSEIRQDGKPKYFYDEESKLYTAMFPDFAGAKPCVTCHNEHPETTKTDWKMGDIMGATTWTYPSDSVSFEELQGMIMAYRDGAAATFQKYLDKTETFSENETPKVGDVWPSAGYQLPSPTEFLDSVNHLSSKNTLKGILKM